MKKTFFLLTFMFAALLLIIAQENSMKSTGEVIILEGLISFADKNQSVIIVDGASIPIVVPVDAWPGGLQEGDWVRAQGTYEMGAHPMFKAPVLEKISAPLPKEEAPKEEQSPPPESKPVPPSQPAEAEQNKQEL